MNEMYHHLLAQYGKAAADRYWAVHCNSGNPSTEQSKQNRSIEFPKRRKPRTKNCCNPPQLTVPPPLLAKHPTRQKQIEQSCREMFREYDRKNKKRAKREE